MVRPNSKSGVEGSQQSSDSKGLNSRGLLRLLSTHRTLFARGQTAPTHCVKSASAPSSLRAPSLRVPRQVCECQVCECPIKSASAKSASAPSSLRVPSLRVPRQVCERPGWRVGRRRRRKRPAPALRGAIGRSGAPLGAGRRDRACHAGPPSGGPNRSIRRRGHGRRLRVTTTAKPCPAQPTADRNLASGCRPWAARSEPEGRGGGRIRNRRRRRRRRCQWRSRGVGFRKVRVVGQAGASRSAGGC